MMIHQRVQQIPLELERRLGLLALEYLALIVLAALEFERSWQDPDEDQHTHARYHGCQKLNHGRQTIDGPVENAGLNQMHRAAGKEHQSQENVEDLRELEVVPARDEVVSVAERILDEFRTAGLV